YPTLFRSRYVTAASNRAHCAETAHKYRWLGQAARSFICRAPTPSATEVAFHMNNASSRFCTGLRRQALWVLLGVMPLLAACGGSERSCISPDEPYLAAENNPPLRVPEGLDAPDRSEALTIPDLHRKSVVEG